MLDTNTLYPASMRDILLQLAVLQLFQPKWSPDIYREWMNTDRKLRKDHDPSKVRRTQELMNALGFNALVTGYQHLIDDIDLPDPDDRHVLAAARHGNCDTIVTQNLSDFPAEALKPFGIEARHPDDFLLNLLETSPDVFLSAVRKIRRRLKNPPYTVEEYLANLTRNGLAETGLKLREYAQLLE